MRPPPYPALVAAASLAASSAGAASWISPPAAARSTGTVLCIVQNLDTRPRTVSVRLRTAVGSVLDEFTGDAAPGIAYFAATGPPVFSGHHQCEFDGLSRKVRGFLEVLDDAGGVILSLPAAK